MLGTQSQAAASRAGNRVPVRFPRRPALGIKSHGPPATRMPASGGGALFGRRPLKGDSRGDPRRVVKSDLSPSGGQKPKLFAETQTRASGPPPRGWSGPGPPHPPPTEKKPGPRFGRGPQLEAGPPWVGPPSKWGGGRRAARGLAGGVVYRGIYRHGERRRGGLGTTPLHNSQGWVRG